MKTSKRLFVLAVILCVATAMTAQACRNCSFSESDIYGVVIELQNILKEAHHPHCLRLPAIEPPASGRAYPL